MADVDRDRRGQLFLVTALSLAVVFVALAVLLNTAIFTEHLATRSNNAASVDAVEYRESAVATTERVLSYANYHNNSTGHDAIESTVKGGLSEWSGAAGVHAAGSSRLASTSVSSTTDGTRIAQTDPTRNFSDRHNNSAWTLASNVHARNFTMTVQPAEVENGGSSFKVTFYADNTWTVTVSDDGTEFDVAVSGTDSGSCQYTYSSTSEFVTIDFGNASVGDSHCTALTKLDGITGTYSIEYANVHQLNGTYSLIVDDAIANGTTTPYYADTAESPFTTPAVYSVALSVSYRSPRVRYVTTVEEVGRGEFDE